MGYIFTGEDTDFVRARVLEFAKGLNCETHRAGAFPPACGKCISCRVFDSGNHPDTFFIKGTKQSGIGVDDVRDFILLPVAQKPFKYKYKIFIIENSLTPAAQNALLKTIEEPAPYGVFLFIAPNTHGFLPTILSRCVVKKLRGADIIDGETTPESETQSEMSDLAHEIIEAATGLSDSEKIIGAFALYRRVEHFAKDKDALHKFLDLLYIICGKKIRDAAQSGQPPTKYLSAATATANTKQILARNGNTQLALELMFLKMTGESL